MLRIKQDKFTALFAVLALLSISVLAQAPQVSLQGINGSSFDLAASRGKAVVLSFGGSDIPLAAKQLAALQKLADRYNGKAVQFYWVSTNSAKTGARGYATDADLQAFAQKNGLRIAVLRDAERSASRTLGLDAFPTLVVLNQNGQVSLTHVGFDPDQGEAYADVIRTLDQILK